MSQGQKHSKRMKPCRKLSRLLQVGSPQCKRLASRRGSSRKQIYRKNLLSVTRMTKHKRWPRHPEAEKPHHVCPASRQEYLQNSKSTKTSVTLLKMSHWSLLQRPAVPPHVFPVSLLGFQQHPSNHQYKEMCSRICMLRMDSKALTKIWLRRLDEQQRIFLGNLQELQQRHSNHPFKGIHSEKQTKIRQPLLRVLPRRHGVRLHMSLANLPEFQQRILSHLCKETYNQN